MWFESLKRFSTAFYWSLALFCCLWLPSGTFSIENLSAAEVSPEFTQLCSDLRIAVKKLGWKQEPCTGIDWQVGGKSVNGRPIIYAVFGDADATNTTLVFSMVHGDENTPLYLGLHMAEWVGRNQDVLHRSRVVIAPLINPDGFFASLKTRVNSRKVDVNRNLPTKDWDKDAQSLWKTKFRSDPRRYPGPSANSEPETQFQLDLIEKFKPHKILSIHAPLNFLDYDGPDTLSLKTFGESYVKQCLTLRSKLKAKSSGFFPGSLGNYAGQERGIPTLTLELPSANAAKASSYWFSFKPGIRTMLDFDVPPVLSKR